MFGQTGSLFLGRKNTNSSCVYSVVIFQTNLQYLSFVDFCPFMTAKDVVVSDEYSISPRYFGTA